MGSEFIIAAFFLWNRYLSKYSICGTVPSFNKWSKKYAIPVLQDKSCLNTTMVIHGNIFQLFGAGTKQTFGKNYITSRN